MNLNDIKLLYSAHTLDPSKLGLDSGYTAQLIIIIIINLDLKIPASRSAAARQSLQ